MDSRMVKNLLKKENPIILEVGACMGEDTINFLEEFKDILIYCFEPDPRCIAGFKKNIKDDRCTLIEAAVSNEDGKAALNISGGWPAYVPRVFNKLLGLARCYRFIVTICNRIRGKEWHMSSSIKKSVSHSKDYPWLTFNETVECKTIKLDTFTKENNISFIDFMWVDVQGAERDVIEGGGRNTLKVTKYFYVEYGEISSYPSAMARE